MLHPRRTGDSLSLDEVTRLRRAIRGVLRRAIRFNGSTFLDYRSPDGARGEFQNYLRVYQKEGKPCRRCGAAIERMAMGGRSTFFCPFCQAISHSVPSFARERRR
jgi:formamidopyrimidine-DNA glycosylase